MKNLSLFLSLLISSFLPACAPSVSDSSEPATTQEAPTEPVLTEYQINLSDVRDEKCLNLEKYFSRIHLFSKSLQTQRISSHLLTPQNSEMRPNFLLLVAYGSFVFERTTIDRIKEVPVVKQSGCENVDFYDPSGMAIISSFKVQSMAENSLQISNEEESYLYTWISPTSFEVKTKYRVFDYLCNDKFSAEFELTKAISWNPPEFSQQLNVDQSYLTLVTQAAGVSLESLYHVTATSHKLAPEKLTELSSKLPQEQLYSCN